MILRLPFLGPAWKRGPFLSGTEASPWARRKILNHRDANASHQQVAVYVPPSRAEPALFMMSAQHFDSELFKSRYPINLLQILGLPDVVRTDPSPHSSAGEAISTEARRVSMTSSSKSSPGQKGSCQEPAHLAKCPPGCLLRLQQSGKNKSKRDVSKSRTKTPSTSPCQITKLIRPCDLLVPFREGNAFFKKIEFVCKYFIKLGLELSGQSTF